MSVLRIVFAILLAVSEVLGTQSLVKTTNSGPGSTPKLHNPLREEHDTTLLQADTSEEEDSKAVRDHRKAKFPQPPGFFGDFSQGESTYTYDGTLANRKENPMVDVLDGWNPPQSTPSSKAAESATWFEDTRSGGEKRAWQTFYPAMPDSSAGNQVPNGDWFKGTGNVWQQDYKSPATLASGNMDAIPASWFDSSVNQLDGFGREKYPGYGEQNPRNYLYWEERSVNTTFECKDPGCTASSSLKAPFNPKVEIARDCKLSVFVHPTDFDDQYSGEEVSWIQLFDKVIMEHCHPMDHGGNATAGEPLLPCVQSLPIDTPDNFITITAKIPMVVDENPFKDKMLAGVSMLTCMVQPKPKPPPPPPPQTAKLREDSCTFTAPLQCTTRGCVATIGMNVGKFCLDVVGKCTLNVTVNQTDYDNEDTTAETIEYIKVDGEEPVKNVKPGQNPCKSKFAGKTVKPSELIYDAVTNHALSYAKTMDGTVMIEGKISPYVDECASEGYLFSAVANIHCAGSLPAAPVAFLGKRPSKRRLLAHSA